MSLVRFLPTPSDRMGIIWSLLAVQGSIVLEYGPSGTTHYSMGLYGGLGLRFQNRLFTTHLSEDDVVMGDVTRLEEAIVELDKCYTPQVIFVVASSVTAVIGTDIKGVCNYMQREVKAKLVAFDQGGFRGDYSIGLRETYRLLVKNLVRAPEGGVSGTYNLLGASVWRYRMASDIWEIQNLLKEALGLHLHTALCCNTDVQEIAAMSEAELNIVIGNEGLAAAKFLQEQYGTPYVYAVPYGYRGTIDFLEAVSAASGRQLNMETLMRLTMKEKGMSMLSMFALMGGGKVEPHGFVMGDYDMVRGVSAFLQAAGISVDYKLCSHSFKALENLPADNSVISCTEENDWLPTVRGLRHHLICASDVVLQQADDSNTKVLLAAPFLKGTLVAEHLPFMGEKGADYLLEQIYVYYQSF